MDDQEIKTIAGMYVVANKETGGSVSALFDCYELAEAECERLELLLSRSDSDMEYFVREANSYDLKARGLARVPRRA